MLKMISLVLVAFLCIGASAQMSGTFLYRDPPRTNPLLYQAGASTNQDPQIIQNLVDQLNNLVGQAAGTGHNPNHGSSSGGYPGTGNNQGTGGGYPSGGYPGSGSNPGYPSNGQFPGNGNQPGTPGHFPGNGNFPGQGNQPSNVNHPGQGNFPVSGNNNYPGNFPGSGNYPGSGNNNNYPGSSNYPGGSSNYPDNNQVPGNYPGSSGGSYPGSSNNGNFPGSGSYPGSSSNGGNSIGGSTPAVGGSGTCKYWCRTPEGQAYCCDDNNTHSDSSGSSVGVKRGSCPAVRPQCPPTRLGVSPPLPCSNDLACRGVDKCCYDRCLQHHVCKPPLN